MMHELITANRAELIALCRVKVAQRAPPGVPEQELAHGVSIFLDQLIKTLIVEQSDIPLLSRRMSGAAGGGKPMLSEIGESASLHGKALQAHGFTIEEVVHDRSPRRCQSSPDQLRRRFQSSLMLMRLAQAPSQST